MLDALNAIVAFLNMIVDKCVTFIHYLGTFLSFIGKGIKFLYSFVEFVPVELQAIAGLTIVLSVVLLILGRSNNNG